MPEPTLLKIGEFARLAGTNLRTLRYYEELGLLSPASRSAGGFRYYREAEVHRVQMIRDLQELGLQLETIRDLIQTRQEHESRPQFLSRVRRALEEHSRMLSERQRTLEAQQAKVLAALQKLHECSSCALEPFRSAHHCDPCQNNGQPLPGPLSALYP